MMSPDRTLHDDELARELRAMRPELDPEFGAKLDSWAAEGFPSARPGQTAPRAPRRRLRVSFPRLALAASMLLALVVSVGVIAALEGSGDDSLDGLGSGGELGSPVDSGQIDGDAARQSAPSAESAGDAAIEPAPGTIAPAPPIDGPLKPGRPRQVERTASMTLSTEPDEVAEVADGVIEVTERYDGIVVSSRVSTAEQSGRASFDLRIPSQNLQATLADLSDLASVAARNEGTLDITAPFVSAQERFDDAKAEADALLARLAEADSAAEIASIRAQLSAARVELAAARAELASAKQRAGFSKLAITVAGDGDADGWSIGDALDDAVSVLEDLGGATIVALAALIPLGLIAAAAWFAYARINRRRRDRLLDQ